MKNIPRSGGLGLLCHNGERREENEGKSGAEVGWAGDRVHICSMSYLITGETW